MKSTPLAERLETAECRKDNKARRVLNVAPDTLADITADEIENGITLERLDALNVPALRYSTQITIHGKLPPFNASARPGGYKAIVSNENGSVGVRYAAIDTTKKAILARCARVSESGWHTSSNSTGFQVSRSFYVKREEERTAQKEATINALRTFPVARFYGSAFAGLLAYGLGYYVCADIGAIPLADVWPFCAEVFGVADLADLESREAIEKAKQDAKHAQWEAESKVRQEQDATRRAETLATLTPINVVPINGTVYVSGSSGILTVQLTRESKRDYYRITARDGVASYDARKLAKAGFPWPKALATNRVYVDASTLANEAETPKETQGAPSVGTVDKDRNAPMSKRQSFALYCATGKDWRTVAGITYGKASDALASVQHLRGQKAQALAIVAPMLSPS